MICPKIFLIIWICAFFISYLFVGFLGSICKFFGEGGAKYINFRAKIKILFVNIQTSIFFFFQKVGGGGGVASPPLPLSSSVIGGGGPMFWHL